MKVTVSGLPSKIVRVSCIKPNAVNIVSLPKKSVTVSVARDGKKGDPGDTPTISSDTGNWTIGGVDTGIKAKGEKGDPGNTPMVSPTTGNWTISGVDTGIKARGDKGDPGNTPTISPITGNWTIGGVDTGIKAASIWGNIIGSLAAQTDLMTVLELLSPKNNPTFTGTVFLTQIANAVSTIGMLTLGTGSAPITATRNTNTSAPVFRVRNLSQSSTGNSFEVDTNVGGVQAVRAGFEKAGFGFGPNAVALNHFVTLGQIPFRAKIEVPTIVFTGTAQQIIYSYKIPANTFKIGTVFQVKCWIDRGLITTQGTLVTNFYIGSTASSLVFNNICGTHTRGTTANYIMTTRTYIVEAGGIRCIQWNLNNPNDENVTVALSNVRPFDYTQDQWFIVAGTNANAVDTFQGYLFTLTAQY